MGLKGRWVKGEEEEMWRRFWAGWLQNLEQQAPIGTHIESTELLLYNIDGLHFFLLSFATEVKSCTWFIFLGRDVPVCTFFVNTGTVQDKQELVVNLLSVSPALSPGGKQNGSNSFWAETGGIRLQLAPCQQLLSVDGTILWDFRGVGTTEPAGAEICRIC